MAYTLILAHFLGDFPLQPNWMASRKSNFWVLSLHVSIHFIVMLLLVGQVRLLIWPYLLLLTLVHMGQDRLKVALTNLWPARTVFFFFIDQLLHYSAIWGLTVWIRALNPNLVNTQTRLWVIIAIAYLVVTYTWYISERVINHADAEYLKNIEETKIARMLARGGLVSLFPLVRAATLPYLAVLFSWPYPASIYRKRALFSDVGISLLVIIFLLVTLR
jgi:hypothetical protein